MKRSVFAITIILLIVISAITIRYIAEEDLKQNKGLATPQQPVPISKILEAYRSTIFEECYRYVSETPDGVFVDVQKCYEKMQKVHDYCSDLGFQDAPEKLKSYAESRPYSDTYWKCTASRAAPLDI